MNDIMLTQNTDKLRQEVAKHVAADTITQGVYWNSINNSGCWIGCLAKSNDPAINEATYGLPVMVQRIAEKIFMTLPDAEAKAFFAALPDAVNCDGKDLTKVGWQFLAAELRSLPNCTDQVQAVIDPVITGMDLLASGQEWADAARAARAAEATDATVANANADEFVMAAARAAARAAAARADAVRAATWAAFAAGWAVAGAVAAAWAVARAAEAVADADADADAARLRQRDLLMRLISEAPVVEALK
jgi:hypothetical protein